MKASGVKNSEMRIDLMHLAFKVRQDVIKEQREERLGIADNELSTRKSSQSRSTFGTIKINSNVEVMSSDKFEAVEESTPRRLIDFEELVDKRISLDKVRERFINGCGNESVWVSMFDSMENGSSNNQVADLHKVYNKYFHNVAPQLIVQVI